MQEPTIPDFLKPFGQHVLQEALQEGHRIQRHRALRLVVGLVAERDLC
jgi:hypothetical protein